MSTSSKIISRVWRPAAAVTGIPAATHAALTSSASAPPRGISAALPPQDASAASRPTHKTITLMSWNILADGLAQYGDFTHAAPEILTWEYRWPLIRDEIAVVQPDICALYEMNHPEMLAQQFKEYAMVFVPKIQSAALAHGAPPDGIAILVKRDRFDVAHVEVRYYCERPEGPVQNQNAVLITLHDVAANRSLLVAATHLKAKKAPRDVATRTHQMTQLMKFVDKAVASHSRHVKDHETYRGLPVIICGDWNGSPAEPLFEQVMSHPLRFRSAYNSKSWDSSVSISGWAAHEPEFTTWKWRTSSAGSEEKCSAIDYIMCSTATSHPAAESSIVKDTCLLQPVEILQLPSKEDIGPTGLPTAAYPSDHLSLAVRLQWVAANDA